jgi:hypothetical protein
MGSGVIIVAAGVGPVVAVQPAHASSPARRRRKIQIVFRVINLRLPDGRIEDFVLMMVSGYYPAGWTDYTGKSAGREKGKNQ